jgi:hypothetical protein
MAKLEAVTVLGSLLVGATISQVLIGWADEGIRFGFTGEVFQAEDGFADQCRF